MSENFGGLISKKGGIMSTVEFKYENGDRLIDLITGFRGVVMVRAEYSTGCHHYGMQGKDLKDGVPADWIWLDDSRLKLQKKKVVDFLPDGKQKGGAFPSGPMI